VVVLAHLLKFFGLLYFILHCSFDKLHFSRSFRQFCYLARFRNFSFTWRYLVPRSVTRPSAVFVSSTRCIPSIFYVRGIFFDFPKFRNFAVIFRYFRCLYRCRVMLSFIVFFILLRYSFLLFSMPRFIFLVYSAVK
jgi:hypothetical protein